MIAATPPVQERIILFTRYPEPGKTKTRLIPALGEVKAAALQKEMTEEILARAITAAQPRTASIEIRYDGGDDQLMGQWLGNVSHVPQGDGDLGEKMHRAIGAALAGDIKGVLVIGADCPSLTPAIMTEALDHLHHVDLVLGPAGDGGYYSIGVSRDLPQLFSGIFWGTEKVLEQTMNLARDLGLTLHILPTLNDIDRPEDLADPALAKHLKGVSL